MCFGYSLFALVFGSGLILVISGRISDFGEFSQQVFILFEALELSVVIIVLYECL